MSSASVTAVSGLNAAAAAMGVSAHNIANQQMPDFRRQVLTRTTASDGGVSTSVEQAPVPGHALETDVVSQLAAKHAFLANLAVFRTSDAMAGRLLSLRA